MVKPVDTTYPRLKLDKIAEVISNLPSDKKFINKIKKLVIIGKSCMIMTNLIGQWLSI